MIMEDPANQALSSAEEAEDLLKEKKVRSSKDKAKKSRKEKSKSADLDLKSDDEDELRPPPPKRKTKKQKDQDSSENIALPKNSDTAENDESKVSQKKKSKKTKEQDSNANDSEGYGTKSESEEEGAKTPNRKGRKKSKDGGYSSEDGGKSDDEDVIDKSSKKKSKKSKPYQSATDPTTGLVSRESGHEPKNDELIDSAVDKISATTKKKGKKQKESAPNDLQKEKGSSVEPESDKQSLPKEKLHAKEKDGQVSATAPKKDSTKSKKSDKGQSTVVSGGPLSKEESIMTLPEEESMFHARDDEASAKTLPRKNTSKKSIESDSNIPNKPVTEDEPSSKASKEGSKNKPKRRSSKDGTSGEGRSSSSSKTNEETSTNKSKTKRRSSSDGATKQLLSTAKKSLTRSQSTPRMRLGEAQKGEFPSKKVLRSTSRPRPRSSSEDRTQPKFISREKGRASATESPMRRRHSEDWGTKLDASDKGKRPKSRMKGREKPAAQGEVPTSPRSKGQSLVADPEKTPTSGNKPKLTKRNSKKKLMETLPDVNEKGAGTNSSKNGVGSKPPLSPTAAKVGTTSMKNASKTRKDVKKEDSVTKPIAKKAFKRQNSGLLREIKGADEKGVKDRVKRKSSKQDPKIDGQSGFNFQVPLAEPKIIKVKPQYKTKSWKRFKTVTLDCLGDDYIIRETQRNKFGGRLDHAADATGFFYVKKIRGRWSFIDPDGQLFYSVGLNGVGTHKDDKHFREGFTEKYKNSTEWANETKTFIFEKLGFNTMGCWSSATDFQEAGHNAPYCPHWNFMQTYCKKRTRGSMKLSDGMMPIFDPEFEVFCDEHAKQLAAKKDDPWILGHFSDNELPMKENDIINRYLATPEDDPGHVFTKKWLEERDCKIVTADHNTEFCSEIIGRYFRLVSSAIKKYDPNHLYLGTRFHGFVTRQDITFLACAPWVDVVSCNYYHRWCPEQEWITRWATQSQRPILITEWYAKGEDAKGCDNSSGAGFTVGTQEDRGAFYENFTIGLLRNPNVIGWHWYRYIDKGANMGVLDSTYAPYSALAESMQKINTKIYSLSDYLLSETAPLFLDKPESVDE